MYVTTRFFDLMITSWPLQIRFSGIRCMRNLAIHIFMSVGQLGEIPFFFLMDHLKTPVGRAYTRSKIPFWTDGDFSRTYISFCTVSALYDTSDSQTLVNSSIRASFMSVLELTIPLALAKLAKSCFAELRSLAFYLGFRSAWLTCISLIQGKASPKVA